VDAFVSEHADFVARRATTMTEPSEPVPTRTVSASGRPQVPAGGRVAPIGSGNREPLSGGRVANLRCRCSLPIGEPKEQHWWPAHNPEPDTGVRAVALAGQDPGFLRAERCEDGWHTYGLGAAHPDASPPRGWGGLGQCWDGVEHAVVDASDWLAQQRAKAAAGRGLQPQARHVDHAESR